MYTKNVHKRKGLTKAITLLPDAWARRSPNIATKLPSCRLSAVGSNPQYIFTLPDFSRSFKCSSLENNVYKKGLPELRKNVCIIALRF